MPTAPTSSTLFVDGVEEIFENRLLETQVGVEAGRFVSTQYLVAKVSHPEC